MAAPDVSPQIPARLWVTYECGLIHARRHVDGPEPLGKSTLRTSRHIIKGSDNNTPYLGFNEYYAMHRPD
jgi:hypothetical protein